MTATVSPSKTTPHSRPRPDFLWLFLMASVAVAGLSQSAATAAPEMVECRQIWNHAPHNAFTDLIRFRDTWFCVFREGQGHVSPDGALRVIASPDGRQWKSAALIEHPLGDLRDAKITLTPDGQLMLNGAAALPAGSPEKHRSLAWFSPDGYQWSEGIVVAHPNQWLWRVTWHESQAYGISYATSEPRHIRLYTSSDGRRYETLVPNLFESGYPNETSILFDDNDQALCLLRRDGDPNTALLGFSSPPYKTWDWQDLGVRIGGPHMIRLPDDRLVAAVRFYDGGARTSLAWVHPDPARPSLEEFLKLPSGGDTSYAGLVWHQNHLWVSYYSSHEGKTSIYFAQVRL